MKKRYLIIPCLVIYFNGAAQQLSQVAFSNGAVFSWFSLLTNQNILIRISDDGKILEYGTEESSYYNKNYFAPKLVHWSGSVNYYEQTADFSMQRKSKKYRKLFLYVLFI